MLVCRRTRLAPHFSVIRHGAVLPSNRRHFIQNLCDGFLDLAIGLPLPLSFPPYSTTIILVTAATRLAILPVAIWGKRRQWRLEENVLPEMEKLKPTVYQAVLTEMRRSGFRGTKDEIKAEHAKRSLKILNKRQEELLNEHHCRPRPTMLVPVLSQLPVFVIMSAMFARLSIPPTVFDSESFLTLTTLAHPDPTMALPIFLGVVTMANVESSQWLMNTAELEREKQLQEWRERKRAESGQSIIEPRKLMKTGFRILSIGRIVFAAIMPGGVVLYWVTSATIGLLQTLVFDWIDVKRRRSRSQPPLPPSTPTPSKLPASRSIPRP